jgi:hypothetical protein
MSQVLIKLKKESTRERLSTISGVCINKQDWVLVEDTVPDVEAMILYRNDILLKNPNEVESDKEDTTPNLVKKASKKKIKRKR